VKIHVQVTQDDIEKGRLARDTYGSSSLAMYCPVARAISRATGIQPYVEGTEVEFTNPLQGDLMAYRSDGYVVVPLPQRARAWIIRFDRKLTALPFEFDLIPYEETGP
jgi:hypothetical protein